MASFSSITVNATIGEALQSIDASAQQITLVTASDGLLIATLTDGDIRRGLLRGLKLSSNVMEVANKNFVSLPQSTPAIDVIEVMKSKSLLHVPVLDDHGRVVSLMSLKDFVGEVSKTYENPIIFMAGGKGKRLRPFTENCPKPMLLVDGKPILEILLENFISSGFRNYYFSVNYLKDQIIDYFGDGSKWGVSIKYLVEEKPLGTAGALHLISDVDMPFMVVNGDVLTKLDPASFLHFHLNSDASASLSVWQHSTTIPFGVVKVNGMELIDFIEKPTLTHLVNAGIYVLNPDILSFLPYDEYIDMPTLLEDAKSSGRKVAVFPLHEYWIDIGRPETLTEAVNSWPSSK